MGLSHRVTELLENWLGDKIPAMVSIEIYGTTTKESTNLVNVDTTATGTTILSANADRVSYFIQNHGTVPVLLSFGEDTSITNYSKILAPATGIRAGDGGTDSDTDELIPWQGTIKGLTEASSAVISILAKEA